MKKSKILKPQSLSSKTIKNPFEDVSPAFSFKYLIENNRNYNLESNKATDELKCKVLHSLHNYSKRNWDDFIGNKRNTGVEKIYYSNLKKCKVHFPNNSFYNSIKDLNIFRVSNSARIVGTRIGNICYILWFDWDFSSYDHG